MTNISPIKPSGSKSDKVSLNELQLCMWLGDAAPGDTLEYHRGFLVKDIDTGSKQRLKEPDRTILERLASRARWAAERGFAHLVQRRIAPEQFSYLLIARPRAPDARSPLAFIELAAAA
jgi:hypothetical protein